jgi:hypothetical protein
MRNHFKKAANVEERKALNAALQALMDVPNPLKVRIASTAEDWKRIVEEQKELGYVLVATSNTGLRDGRVRLSFLPKEELK